jgi:uncharacterized protein YkwD
MKLALFAVSFLTVIIVVGIITSYKQNNEIKPNSSDFTTISQAGAIMVGRITFKTDFEEGIYSDAEGIKLTIRNTQNGIIHESISDKNGLFYINGLVGGVYEIIKLELKKRTDKYDLSYVLILDLFTQIQNGRANNLGDIIWNFSKKKHNLEYSQGYHLTKIKFETQYNMTNANWIDTSLSENAPVLDKRDMDDENWDIVTLDTARDANYLSAVEKDVILEMNKVRSNPKKYADLYIKPRLEHYSNNIYSAPNKMPISTTEGKKAAQECYEVLSKMQPVQILIPSRGLWQAAKDHASDQSKTGNTGHDGNDGSTPFDRIKRYGTYKEAGENIAYKPNSGREIVVGLLIDDGVPLRGHRENIMHKEYNHIGAAINSHKKYGVICVIEYAKDFVSNRR